MLILHVLQFFFWTFVIYKNINTEGNTRHSIVVIVYKKTDEWYIEWQRVTASGTTSDNKWQRVVQRVTTSGTANDNEWYNEWQRVAILANFSFFQIREEPTTKYPKENSLNLEEDLCRSSIEIRAEKIPEEELLTVRSRNCRSSCSQIFIKISVLKNLAIFIGKHLCCKLFLRTLQVLKPASLLKEDSNTGVFLWILQNF